MEDRVETAGGLGAAVIELLGREGAELRLAPGEVAAREGDEGNAFFVVLEGEADVVREAEGSRDLPLARLGPGSTFGELALLEGGRISASVVAASPLRLLEVPRERFHAALAASEPLRLYLLSRLARDLRRTSDGAVGLHRRAELLRALLTRGGESEPVVAGSAAMKRLVAEAARLADGGGPVLVSGEPGTGRSFAARLLHEKWGAGTPFLAVDGSRLEPGDLDRLLSGPAPVVGAGTVVIRHVDALPEAEQRALLRLLAAAPAPPADGDRPRRVRYVATCTAELEPLVAGGRLLAPLVEAFGARRLRVPTLRERKLDLLPLASLFLERARGERKGRRLSAAAERELAGRSFSQRHVAELREAMELASLLAAGEEVRAEELFSGPKEEPLPFLVDLTDLPGFRAALTGAPLARLRQAVTALFLAVTLLFLAAPAWPFTRALDGLAWGLGEPLLIASFLLAGRLWCSVCPFPGIGRVGQRLAGRGLRAPEGLARHGPLVAAAGFALIVWAERAFRMPAAPRPAGVFFLVLALAALSAALVFEKDLFCRHLCPLGTLGAACSLPAPFQLRATPGVCASLCRTHDCFRGNEKEPGCPVSHHPLYVAEAHACKACFRCPKSCPHGSVRFGFRLPLQGVWRLAPGAVELVPFATTVLATSAALFAAHRLGIEGGTPWALLSLAALALGIGAGRFLQGAAEDSRRGAKAAASAFTLLILGWALMLACEAANWPGAAALRLEPVGLPLLPIVQGAIVLYGLLLATICLFNLSPGHAER